MFFELKIGLMNDINKLHKVIIILGDTYERINCIF